MKSKDDELLHAEPVAGIPERVLTQIAEIEALQEEIASRRADLASLASLSQSMSDTASPEDSLTLSDKMAQLKTAFETLERNVAARKRGLEDGLQQVHVICI